MSDSSDAKFRDLVAGSIQGVIVFAKSDHKPLFVSEQIVGMYGYGTPGEMMLLENLEAMVHPEDRTRIAYGEDRLGAGGEPAIGEFRGLRKDGSIIYVQDKVTPVTWEGEPALLATFADVTAYRRAEMALEKSKRRLDEAQRIAHLGSWTRDFSADVIHWSDEHYRMFGVETSKKEIRPSDFMACVHPEDREIVAAAVEEAIRSALPYDTEYRIQLPGSEIRFIEERGEVTFDDARKPAFMRGTVQDVTERKKTEETARHLANYDALTDLPNRHLFEDRLEKAMAAARRRNEHLAVHFINLNNFKRVNEKFGHAIGDKLLKAVGASLQKVVRASDTLARFGNDEFTVIQTDLVNPQDASVLAKKIIDAVNWPFSIGEHEVRTSATIGIAIYPNDGREVAQLFQNADFALDSSKAKGPNSYEFFDKDMRAAMAQRRRLEDELARALERDEFVLHYQPRIDLDSGHVIGVESLVRWRHPERGLVLPNEFIPYAEKSGLIRPLGAWVLRQACRDTLAWRDAGLAPLSVAVNLSAAQFHDADLVAQVRDALDAAELEPGRLELEITETLMMTERDSKVVPTLERLRELGVQISVDDFGTGYASLTYLRHFPVSKVKVDQTFVQGVTNIPQDKAIVEAVIRLGHGLNLTVTAEGVEEEQVVHFLKAWNCDEAQGFLFSRPLASRDLIALLGARPATKSASGGD
jgi:diguanylate cyclase (GGDEF)-like protein/PAS domain S-box-containing protein